MRRQDNGMDYLEHLLQIQVCNSLFYFFFCHLQPNHSSAESTIWDKSCNADDYGQENGNTQHIASWMLWRRESGGEWT